MKHHPGYSPLKVTVLFGVMTVLLTGCYTGRDDYRGYDRDDDRDYYEHHDHDEEHHGGMDHHED
jgi:hypothetical protein